MQLHSTQLEENGREGNMERKIDFRMERPTRNTYRFFENSEEPLVGTLYVQKTAFKRMPRRIEVILRGEDLVGEDDGEED